MKRSEHSAEQRSMAGRHSRPAVTRALGLLEALAAIEGPASLIELARHLDIPQATAFRLCQRLEEEGYLIREGGTRKYAVSARLARLGIGILRSSGPLSTRHAILADLVDNVGETCNLTTLAGTEVLYLDRVETRWPLRLMLEPGSRVPVHCTASGKLLLASLPKPTRQQILKALKLTPNTVNSMTNRVELDRDLQRITRRGYSTDNEEFLAGLIAVAVPVKDQRGRMFAAVACHAPVARLDLKSAIALVPALQVAAAKLATTFES